VKIWHWVLGIIGVILIVALFRTTAVQNIFGGASSTVSGWVTAILNAPDRARLMALQDKFLRNNMSLKPHQTDYVYEITGSIDKVRTFYRLYCVDKDKNPYLFGNNLMKFCSDIEQSDVLITEKE